MERQLLHRIFHLQDFQFPAKQENGDRQPNQQAAEYYQNTEANSFKNLGQVKDIMTSPILSINQAKSLADAWHIMEKYEIHHLAIVNDNGAYIGMLSEKKIVPFLMANAGASLEKNLATATQLSVFCQETLLSTHPDTLVSDLGSALLEYGLDGIAVTDKGEIVGMVTYSDIMKIILKTQSLEVNA